MISATADNHQQYRQPPAPYGGSDEHNGWPDDTHLDDIDLPDPCDFPKASQNAAKYGRWGTVAAVLIIAAIALLILSGVW